MEKSVSMKGEVILLLSYVLYILCAFFADASSAKLTYVRTIIVMMTAVVFLLLRPAPLNFKRNLVLFTAALFVGLYAVVSPVSDSDIYVLIFYVNIIILAIYFRNVSISDRRFLGSINLFYILYLLLSIVLWSGVIPNPRENVGLIEDEFKVNFGIISYYVMPGIEGSPSYVDSFSGLVFLLNVIMKSGQSLRKLAIASSVIGILASFRMTPIVSIVVLLLVYPFLRTRLLFVLFHILSFGSFVMLVVLVHHQVVITVFGVNIDISLFSYLATHARSMIWDQQIMIMLLDYEWYDYIFGGFDMDRFSIPSYQVSGDATGRELSNPHNSYLLMLFRAPLLAVVLLVISTISFLKSLSKKYFIPVSFILLASYTNSSILSLHNPVYIYVIMYAVTRYKRSGDRVNYVTKYNNRVPALGVFQRAPGKEPLAIDDVSLVITKSAEHRPI